MFTVSVVTQGFVKQASKTLFCADLFFSVLWGSHKARHIFDVNRSVTNNEVPDYLTKSVKWFNHHVKKRKKSWLHFISMVHFRHFISNFATTYQLTLIRVLDCWVRVRRKG